MFRFIRLFSSCVHRRRCQDENCCCEFKARVCFYRFCEVWIPATSSAASLWRTKAGERTCRPSGGAAVDGSVGDGTPPVSSLTVHHICLTVPLFEDCLLYHCIWQSLSTCWQITLCTTSSNWEVDMQCDMSTNTKALSNGEMQKASPDKMDVTPWLQDRQKTARNDDDGVAFVSNIIVPPLVHRGVCEMLVWRTASCLCPQQYVWLAGQLLAGNCILNLDNTILISSSCQCKHKIYIYI